jgi:hypothetical protein
MNRVRERDVKWRISLHSRPLIRCGIRTVTSALREPRRMGDHIMYVNTSLSSAFLLWLLEFNVDRGDRILSRDHKILSDLILEAKLLWNKGQERYISIYASDGSNRWRQIASRPKRPLKSIVLDAGVKELLLDDAHDFLDSKAWYSDRGIPFRRGYLLVCIIHFANCHSADFLTAWDAWKWKDQHDPQLGWRTRTECLCHLIVTCRFGR